MRELVTVPKWGRRMHRVLKSLHGNSSTTGSITRYRDTTLECLSMTTAHRPLRAAVLIEI